MHYALIHRFTFQAIHAVTLGGVEEEPHAHRFTLNVRIRGPLREEEGVVWDFVDVKRRIRPVVEALEGRDLREVADPPTVERVGAVLLARIQRVLPPGLEVESLELWETPEQGVVITP